MERREYDESENEEKIIIVVVEMTETESELESPNEGACGTSVGRKIDSTKWMRVVPPQTRAFSKTM